MVTAALVLYLCTLSRDYAGDGLQFAMIVENGDAADLLKPNHLFYPLIPWGFYRVWELFGWSSGALLPLQVASAIGGAICVGLVYVIARRISRSIPIAAVAATGFAVSFGIWGYSIDAESVTIPLVFALVALVTLFPRDPDSAPRPVLTGIACTVAILAYQSQAIVVIVAITAYLLDSHHTVRERMRASIVVTLTTAGLTVAVYLGVAWFAAGVRSFEELWHWQFAMSELGLWGKPTPHSVVEGGQSTVAALSGPMSAPGATSATTLEKLLFLGFAGLFALPLVLGLVFRRPLLSEHRRTIGVFAVWTVLFGAFGIYWVAGDISFFSPIMVAWWVFAAVVAGVVIGLRPRWIPAVSVVSAVGILAITVHGTVTGIVPAREHNDGYYEAENISAHTNRNDLVVVPGTGELFLTLPYFGQRTTFSLYHHLLGAEQPPSPWIVRPNDLGYGSGTPNPAAVSNALDQEIRKTCARGGSVFFANMSAAPSGRGSTTLRELAEAHVTQYPVRPAAQFGDMMIFRLADSSCARR